MKMKKSKTKLSIVAVIVLAILFVGGCSKTRSNRVEVRVEIPEFSAIPFEKFDKVLYKDIIVEPPIKNYNPVDTLHTFFLNDLGKAINKNIEPWSDEKYGNGKLATNSLIIEGTIKMDIKERSKIEEGKDEKGSKKRSFINIQHWLLNMSITIKNGTDNNTLFKESFEEKMAEADPNSPKFNFDNMFFNVSNQLVLKLIRAKRTERRYLIL